MRVRLLFLHYGNENEIVLHYGNENEICLLHYGNENDFFCIMVMRIRFVCIMVMRMRFFSYIIVMRIHFFFFHYSNESKIFFLALRITVMRKMFFLYEDNENEFFSPLCYNKVFFLALWWEWDLFSCITEIRIFFSDIMVMRIRFFFFFITVMGKNFFFLLYGNLKKKDLICCFTAMRISHSHCR